MATCTSYLYMMDTDWVVTIEYKMTSRGAPATRWDPAEDPEWYIEHIWLSEDCGRKIVRPEWELTGEMFHLVSDLDDTQDAIIHHLHDTCDDEPDYDDYRDRQWERDCDYAYGDYCD